MSELEASMPDTLDDCFGLAPLLLLEQTTLDLLKLCFCRENKIGKHKKRVLFYPIKKRRGKVEGALT